MNPIFGTFRCFLTLYCLIAALERVPGGMFGGTIQSIERQFQIPSRISGFIMAAGDISYVSTVIFLAYLGSQGNSARWIGYGGLVMASACLIISSPGYLLSKSQDSGAETVEIEDADLPFAYCNNNIMDLRSKLQRAKCEQKEDGIGNTAAFGILLAGVILMGGSRTLPRTLGIPLIDDQVKDKRKTPYYFGIITSVRVTGYFLGVLLTAGCSRLYVTFMAPEGMTPRDPHWISAWWLGFVIIGVSLIVPSLMMVCSAHYMPGTQMPKKGQVGNEHEMEAINGDGDDPKVKGHAGVKLWVQIRNLITSIGACLRSPTYTSNLMCDILITFAWNGLSAFSSKYVENHFGAPTYQANLMLGFADVIGYMVGVIFGSYLMRKLKLDGRRAAGYLASVYTISTALTIIMVFLKCQSVINQIGRDGMQHDFQYPACQDCNCTLAPLYPVCSMDGTPYYSPCHAGCTGYNNNGSLEFHSCTCANGTSDAQRVSRDYCKDDCFAPMVAYFAILCLTSIISGTGNVIGMLINLRSVPIEHRSTAVAFSSFAPSLVSALPSTPIFGMIVDAACLLWNTRPCGGEIGACLIYDPGKLRNGITILYISLLGAADFFLLFLLYKAKNLKLMENEEEEVEAEKPTKKPALMIAAG